MAPLRRLSDLLLELEFLEVQLRVIQQSAGTHYTRNLGVRVAALHSRLDQLEARLRLRARELGESDSQTIRALRRRLAAIAESPLNLTGPDRRRRRPRRSRRYGETPEP